jgi:hypothetical protein
MRRRIHACHMRRRIHACHMRRIEPEIQVLTTKKNILKGQCLVIYYTSHCIEEF